MGRVVGAGWGWEACLCAKHSHLQDWQSQRCQSYWGHMGGDGREVVARRKAITQWEVANHTHNLEADPHAGSNKTAQEITPYSALVARTPGARV